VVVPVSPPLAVGAGAGVLGAGAGVLAGAGVVGVGAGLLLTGSGLLGGGLLGGGLLGGGLGGGGVVLGGLLAGELAVVADVAAGGTGGDAGVVTTADDTGPGTAAGYEDGTGAGVRLAAGRGRPGEDRGPACLAGPAGAGRVPAGG
jgi:hypothetical protein